MTAEEEPKKPNEEEDEEGPKVPCPRRPRSPGAQGAQEAQGAQGARAAQAQAGGGRWHGGRVSITAFPHQDLRSHSIRLQGCKASMDVRAH